MSIVYELFPFHCIKICSYCYLTTQYLNSQTYLFDKFISILWFSVLIILQLFPFVWLLYYPWSLLLVVIYGQGETLLNPIHQLRATPFNQRPPVNRRPEPPTPLGRPVNRRPDPQAPLGRPTHHPPTRSVRDKRQPTSSVRSSRPRCSAHSDHPVPSRSPSTSSFESASSGSQHSDSSYRLRRLARLNFK